MPLEQPFTQDAFARLVGIDQSRVSHLTTAGVLARGATAGEWLHAYCKHLREVAAGRKSETGEGLDLVQERARLAKEQADRVELQNRATRGEYAPIEVLGDCLAKLVEMMVASLDQIDGAMAKSAPDLPEPTRLAVLACVADARNKIASRGALGLVVSDIDPDDDIDANDADR